MDQNELLNIYFGKRDTFYYYEVGDKSVIRDNQLSELFGEEVKLVYYSVNGPTEFIYCAKFWKDKSSALRFLNTYTLSDQIKNNYQLREMNREEFIKSIPDKSDVGNLSNDERWIKNYTSKKQEMKYSKVWEEYRKKYKAIEAYKKVNNPQFWLPCKECGLIPLVWEFNNGRSTACGCGENEDRHHSRHAESIMSFVKRNNGSALGFISDELRMNWNQWVKTGQDVYKQMKENNPEIW